MLNLYRGFNPDQRNVRGPDKSLMENEAKEFSGIIYVFLCLIQDKPIYILVKQPFNLKY